MKTLDKSLKIRGEANWLYFIRLEAISLLPTNLGGHSAYQDAFISDFLKFYPDPFAPLKAPRIISCNSCISIFPRRIPFCRIAILCLDRNPGSFPVCRAPTRLLWNWKSLPSLSGAVCLRKLLFMPSSAFSLSRIPQMSGLFTISCSASGRMTQTTFLQRSFPENEAA